MTKLSILIPTLPNRYPLLHRLQQTLLPQVEKYKSDVEIKYHDSATLTTGQKRNELIKSSEGEYTVFIDDDDHISTHYIKSILNGIESGSDVIGIQGWMTTNGTSRVDFEIRKGHPYIEVTRESLERYPFLSNKLGWYVRFPNILSPMKRSISSSARFPNITQGEDYIWALDINKRDLIKTEYFIESMMYHYDKIIEVPVKRSRFQRP